MLGVRVEGLAEIKGHAKEKGGWERAGTVEGAACLGGDGKAGAGRRKKGRLLEGQR